MVTVETKDEYSNAKGGRTKRATTPRTRRVRTGAGREKVKNFFKNNDVLGKVGGILGVLGQGSGNQGQNNTIIDSTPIDNAPEKKPMSTQTKILIGVGVLAVLGVGYYFYQKNK